MVIKGDVLIIWSALSVLAADSLFVISIDKAIHVNIVKFKARGNFFSGPKENLSSQILVPKILNPADTIDNNPVILKIVPTISNAELP
jgi:hypothetical protein